MPQFRTLDVSELTPGAILATSVFDQRFVKLLDSGTRIDQHFIDRLRERGISEVMVKNTAMRVIKTWREPPPEQQEIDSTTETERVERCSSCLANITLRPPAPEYKASAWRCTKCGAIYFCADESDECFGIERIDPNSFDPFLVGADSHSIPPENIKRLVKSVAPGKSPHIDLRKHKRHPITVPVVAVPLAADFRVSGEPMKMTTLNVSLGGAALIHTRVIDAPYLAIDFSAAGIELMQVVLKVLRVRNVGAVYEVAGEFISQLAQP
jgi:predicted RNA-binding Zn-ribbon protein involved in translation (DUF1610 family)